MSVGLSIIASSYCSDSDEGDSSDQCEETIVCSDEQSDFVLPNAPCDKTGCECGYNYPLVSADSKIELDSSSSDDELNGTQCGYQSSATTPSKKFTCSNVGTSGSICHSTDVPCQIRNEPLRPAESVESMKREVPSDVRDSKTSHISEEVLQYRQILTSSTDTSTSSDDEVVLHFKDASDSGSDGETTQHRRHEFRHEHTVLGLPPIQDLSIDVPAESEMHPIGRITSIITDLAIVDSEQILGDTFSSVKDHCIALAEGTMLFTEHGHQPLGEVFEIFGPVQQPSYTVRLKACGVDSISVGDDVFYAPRTQFTKFVFNAQLQELKRLNPSDVDEGDSSDDSMSDSNSQPAHAPGSQKDQSRLVNSQWHTAGHEGCSNKKPTFKSQSRRLRRQPNNSNNNNRSRFVASNVNGSQIVHNNRMPSTQHNGQCAPSTLVQIRPAFGGPPIYINSIPNN